MQNHLKNIWLLQVIFHTTEDFNVARKDSYLQIINISGIGYTVNY